MSRECETVVRRLIDEGFTGGRLEVADDLVADDLVEHQAFGPNHPAGAEGVRAVIGSLHAAFGGFRLEIQDLTVADDLVWTRNVASGIHRGTFMGHPATGRPMRMDVFDVLRVRDGRVIEHWGVPDRLGALFQIGAVLPPGPPVAVS